MVIEVSSGLLNQDGSDSMPKLEGNVFYGVEGQVFGVINQGAPKVLRYNASTTAVLDRLGSGNVVNFIAK
jgi:hypothetical protein